MSCLTIQHQNLSFPKKPGFLPRSFVSFAAKALQSIKCIYRKEKLSVKIASNPITEAGKKQEGAGIKNPVPSC